MYSEITVITISLICQSENVEVKLQMRSLVDENFSVIFHRVPIAQRHYTQNGGGPTKNAAGDVEN